MQGEPALPRASATRRATQALFRELRTAPGRFAPPSRRAEVPSMALGWLAGDGPRRGPGHRTPPAAFSSLENPAVARRTVPCPSQRRAAAAEAAHTAAARRLDVMMKVPGQRCGDPMTARARLPQSTRSGGRAGAAGMPGGNVAKAGAAIADPRPARTPLWSAGPRRGGTRTPPAAARGELPAGRAGPSGSVGRGP